MWFLQPLLSGVPGIERVRMTIYYAQEALFGKFNYIVKEGWVLIIKNTRADCIARTVIKLSNYTL